MIPYFNIEPEWDVSEFYNLDYFLTTHKDENLLDEYESVGHNKNSMTLYNCHEPSYMPQCLYDYIKPKFDFLDHIALAINLFKPGQYLPVHQDIFGKYKKIYNISFEKVVRYVVMLEDSFPGQIIQISDLSFSKWKSGDCFGWQDTQLHAFYNFSMKDRYAVQVTGVMK
jgi:hypothetical protein